ncbi:MAG: group 1 truncated hemoglobin [Burkholderiaceae bacterium]|nr:group 1 truncated hemoglobin [Burkholderiaceae bacterium]
MALAMKTLQTLTLMLCALLACAQPASAQPSAPPQSPPDAALLAAFGGEAGVRRLADLLVERMRADARIGHYFERTNLAELKKQLGDQLCQLLAGPCVYQGAGMREAHADMGIRRADSLAQVELLQDVMDQLGVPFAAQNRLLARLAPMYREIIER